MRKRFYSFCSRYVSRFGLVMLVVFVMLLVSPFALAEKTDIAVVRGETSPFLNLLYFSFVSNSKRKFITFNYRSGDEVSIAKSIQVADTRAVLLLGDSTLSILPSLDEKLPVLLAGHERPQLTEEQQRRVNFLPLDLGATQYLEVIDKVFPAKKRLGFAYNPKLTQSIIDDYRGSIQRLIEKDANKKFELVILKIDQPSDLVSLVGTFQGKVDLFFLIPDATVVKAGVPAIYPVLRSGNIPLVATSEGFSGEGIMVSVAIDPRVMGRRAWETIERMVRGQRTFRNEYENSDIQLTFSLREFNKFKSNSESTLSTLSAATAAGYQVHLLP